MTTSTATIDLIIIDDHPEVGAALADALPRMGNFRVVAVATCCADALDLVSRVPAHLVLLDLSIDGKANFHLLRQIQAISPTLPVAILSMTSSADLAEKALDCGAAGYFCKGTRLNVLLQGITTIVRGGIFIDPLLREQ